MRKWKLINHTFYGKKSDTLEWWYHMYCWYKDKKLQDSMVG